MATMYWDMAKVRANQDKVKSIFDRIDALYASPIKDKADRKERATKFMEIWEEVDQFKTPEDKD